MLSGRCSTPPGLEAGSPGEDVILTAPIASLIVELNGGRDAGPQHEVIFKSVIVFITFNSFTMILRYHSHVNSPGEKMCSGLVICFLAALKDIF